ncbi:MAG: response regulator [Ktedonobacteraceae bacterium]|nr:response regulator [Ktedonobacteraceae bacterium]MBO0794706.1 response regulator [Ktedonobacteraceae bacterium]
MQNISPLDETTYPWKLILIVDDDEDFGTDLVQVIHSETPYHAIYARDAFEALRITRHLQCDLLLLDYLLPGIDGIDLYDLLHSQPSMASTPTILMSASTRLPQRAIEQRTIPRLNKPFELDDLFDALRQFLGEPTPQQMSQPPAREGPAFP